MSVVFFFVTNDFFMAIEEVIIPVYIVSCFGSDVERHLYTLFTIVYVYCIINKPAK